MTDEIPLPEFTDEEIELLRSAYEEQTNATPIPTYDTGNGVKPRFDGGGSEFGLVHRDLGRGYLMMDVDRLSATIEVGLELKREDECFVEYRHRYGDIVFIAMFELKGHKTEYAKQALDSTKSVTRARLKMAQMMECRLFVVYATNGTQPFEFYEIDTASGDYECVGELTYSKDNQTEKVKHFWNHELGIYK